MNKNRMEIQEFINKYLQLEDSEKSLKRLQKALEEKNDVGFLAEIQVDGTSYSLHKLLGGTMEDVFHDFSEELLSYILYLIKQNELAFETLIESVELKKQQLSSDTIEEKSSQSITEKQVQNVIQKYEKQVVSSPNETGDAPSPEHSETPEENAPFKIVAPSELSAPLSFQTIKERVLEKLKGIAKGGIINPITLLDRLSNEGVSLSDIHVVLRELVEQSKMQIIHFAPCYKCDAEYKQYYEKLPRDVVCENCGQDIVSLEIHYKKGY